MQGAQIECNNMDSGWTTNSLTLSVYVIVRFVLYRNVSWVFHLENMILWKELRSRAKNIGLELQNGQFNALIIYPQFDELWATNNITFPNQITKMCPLRLQGNSQSKL